MRENSQNADSKNRKYFIVKHGRDAFEAHPEWIWNTYYGRGRVPRGYDRIRKGDRWVSFAYTTSDKGEQRLSLVTGFYECTQKREYFTAGHGGLRASDGEHAWVIRGKPCGWQPSWQAGVPPIRELLGRNTFNQQAITRIGEGEFNHIRREALNRAFDARKIPLLGRPPSCEQEVLSIVVAARAQLGIKRIIHIRKAFPDLLVELEGSRKPVHLEVETYSQGFCLHGHQRQVRNRRFKEDGRRAPVAVLCWVDNDERVGKYVHRVYELQSLFRGKKKIKW